MCSMRSYFEQYYGQNENILLLLMHNIVCTVHEYIHKYKTMIDHKQLLKKKMSINNSALDLRNNFQRTKFLHGGGAGKQVPMLEDNVIFHTRMYGTLRAPTSSSCGGLVVLWIPPPSPQVTVERNSRNDV